MRVQRFLARCLASHGLISAAASWLALAGGCQPAPEPFSALQPEFFAAANLFSDEALRGRPAFEERMERMAAEVSGRQDRGELASDAERIEASRALLYTAFMPILTQHAVEDGFMTADDATQWTGPGSGSEAGTATDKLLARMRHAAALLDRALALRPDDAATQSVRLSAQLNEELLLGQPSEQTLEAWLAQAGKDRFGLFTAILLFRDPARFPLSSSVMQRLVEIVCSPAPTGFDCSRMGPPPPADPSEPHWLTSKVAGPVLLSDLLVRRAESLIAAADSDPTMRTPSLSEAKGRLQVAAGSLLVASINVRDDDLSMYPATDTLNARQVRIDQLNAAVSGRLAGTSMPPLPEATSYYQSRTYRAAYQCSTCHMPRENLPASFMGVPK